MGYNAYRDEPKVQELYKNVVAYNKNLVRLGLKDHQVEGPTRPLWKTFLILLWRTGLISAWTIMALPGIILNAPIFIAASYISRKKAKAALAASTVKLEGKDVLATWKVLVSLGMAPILYSLYTVIAMYFVYRYHMGRKYVFLTPLFMLVAVPSFGYSALRFGEVGMDIYK
jgi:glycerol-3-phosphate O-acyltransferase/dihydroxyacetone phosphate acyltransferase